MFYLANKRLERKECFPWQTRGWKEKNAFLGKQRAGKKIMLFMANDRLKGKKKGFSWQTWGWKDTFPQQLRGQREKNAFLGK